MGSAAFFDIDRTLVVGTSLESCFLRTAWRHRVLGPRALLRNLWAGIQTLGLLPARPEERFPIPPGLSPKTRLRYALFSGNKAYLRGLRLEECAALAEAAFREDVLPRLSARGQEVAAAHRAAGRPIVLLTGTLDFLAAPLRTFLQATHLLAARPEVRAGILTGRLAAPHPYAARKRELLRQLAQEQGWDIAASYAYADHFTDVPFLETVGHPVAVNADHRLREVAEARGWAVEEW
jgi:HAD superfamily hydrolase (TIGR01490 family)